MGARLKVLLNCYACDPYLGSEPGTGWQFVKLVAQSHEVHVITERDEFEAHLTQYAAEHPEEMEHITIHYVRRTHWNMLRKIWPPSYYWTYRAWQRKAYKLAGELDAKEHFDVVHQVNLVGFREPGFLWKLDKPYVWGPIAGLNQTAWCLIPCMDARGMLTYTMRNLLNRVQKRLSYAARKVARRAEIIFASDPQCFDEIRKTWRREPRLMREVGVTALAEKREICRHEPGTPLQVCWCGEQEPCKGLNLLLEALTQTRQPMSVHIMGRDGSMKEKWRAMAKRLGVDKQVTFHGCVPHDEVFSIMDACHAYCISSIKEGGTPTVVFEAMQQGLPIVALDHCGFASVVREAHGLLVPLENHMQITRDLAAALDKLALDEDLRVGIARHGLGCCGRFTWEAKKDVLNAAYEEAIQLHKEGKLG